jgi:H+/Cl- antiporter ClcA/CBS domain-containing protein
MRRAEHVPSRTRTHDHTKESLVTPLPGPRSGQMPIAPSMEPALEQNLMPRKAPLVDRRVGLIAVLAMLIAVAAALIAQFLAWLIALITNISFYGRVSSQAVEAAGNTAGLWVLVIPVIGGLIVGVMAKYGSKAIRGHGIPEAMEQVLTNESRIPARITFLKPLSSAIAIGTGGPFGAEGPIIATGGALGSVMGQFLRVTADERKTLLAAGAAAGMAATFGSPVSAVLLAIELLLFEYRARSVIPVALAACVATAMRLAMVGSDPVFPLEHVSEPGSVALVTYIVLGMVVGVASVWVTRAVYAIEDGFEKLPVHWALWPALGGLVVGVVGLFAPRTLGVGYVNIQDMLAGNMSVAALGLLCGAKLVSWLFALGSGTSGGTLAPLFTIGGALGAVLTFGVAHLAPGYGIDPRIGALVGMAAMFGGASRALLTSVIFAFEATRQPLGLLPLLGGCSAAYFVSCLAMPNSIMTEKLARRGMRITSEYALDYLQRVLVREQATTAVMTFSASDTVADAREFFASRAEGAAHNGFPVVDENEQLVGVLTKRDLLMTDVDPSRTLGECIKRPPVVVHPNHTLREACDLMVEHRVGRVVVVDRSEPKRIVGILTRSDLLTAHERRLGAFRQYQGSVIMATARKRVGRRPVHTS